MGIVSSVRAAILQPGQELSFTPCSKDERALVQIATDCWRAQGWQEDVWIADTADFNCGTAGCVAVLHHFQNGKLKSLKDTLSIQCERENDHAYKCFVYTETYRFASIDKRLLAETYQAPYISFLGGKNYLVADISANCFTASGCAAFNYTFENGHYRRGYPFVDLVCTPAQNKNEVTCQTKNKYLDTH